MSVVLVLVLIAAYAFGGIPTANILTRRLRGVDLRGFGSQAVTTSNAGQVLGKRWVVLVGVLDVLKGAVPVWAAQWAGMDLKAQMLIGCAVVAGHNWSPWLKLEGGRGMASAFGVILAAAPFQWLLILVTILAGLAVLRNVPLVLGMAGVLVPAWGAAVGEEPAYVWGSALLVFLLLVKRLLGNRLARLPSEERGRVLLYRLLYDRDTRDRESWIRRGAQG